MAISITSRHCAPVAMLIVELGTRLSNGHRGGVDIEMFGLGGRLVNGPVTLPAVPVLGLCSDRQHLRFLQWPGSHVLRRLRSGGGVENI